MIDLEKLKAVLVDYKRDFVSQQWVNERYIWEAVKCFQDHWDINALNFAEMFTKATEKTYNLLASMNNFPRGMIQGFASTDPEATIMATNAVFFRISWMPKLATLLSAMNLPR